MCVGFYFFALQALFPNARSKQGPTLKPSRAHWAARGTHHLAKLVRRVRVLLDVPRHSPQEGATFHVSCCLWPSASVSPTSRGGPPTRHPSRHGLGPFPYSPCRGAMHSAGVSVCCCGRYRAELVGGGDDGVGVGTAMPPLQPGNSNDLLGVGVAAARRASPPACCQRHPWPHTPHGESPFPSSRQTHAAVAWLSPWVSLCPRANW